jgi:diguanylate cyclase (GGDEF)-like protein/PAS domain S-box-containing protein
LDNDFKLNDQLDNLALNLAYQTRLDWEAVVAAVALRIRHSLALNEILQTTANEVRGLLQCDRVVLYQFAPDWSGEVVVEAVSKPQWSLLHRVVRDPCFEQQWIDNYHEGRYAAIADVGMATLAPCYEEFLARFQIRANLAVPILYQSQLWGLIVAHNCARPRQWRREEITGLQQIATQVGIAIQQASLLEQLQQAKADLEAQVSMRTAELQGVNQKLLTQRQDRDRAEQQLQEQASILRIFYDASPLMMGVVELSDSDILHTSQNRATLEFFNTTTEAMAGKWASELGVSADHLQLWLRHYRQSREQQHPVQFEYQHLTPTRSYWFLVTVDFLGIAQSQRPQFSFIVQDRSDRVSAVANQRKAEQISQELKLMETLFDTILAGYWDWDILNNREYLSPAFKRMFGYADDELPNCPESWQNLIFPEDLRKIQAGLTQHIESHGTIPFTTEVRYRHKNGSTVWVICSGRVIAWDADGNPLRMIGCHIDISDRKQAEIELQAAKDRLELVLHASSEGFWDWNLVADQIYFSPHWKEMLGYADDELENSLATWQSLIFEEDYRKTLELRERYNNGQCDRFSITQRYRHKNGSTVYILSRAIDCKNEQGQVIRMIGSHLDITPMVEIQEALQTSEMLLSGVLNSSLDGIMAFQAVRNDRGEIIDFEWLLSNPTACQVVGRTATELIGKRMLAERPEYGENGLFALYVRVVESGEPIHQELRDTCEGRECWFENVIVKLGDGLTVTLRNITAIKESEKALQQVNQELENRVSDLRQRHQEMLLLSEMSDFLQACLTVEEACGAIATLLKPLFPDCSGSIFKMNTSRNLLENVSSWGTYLHSEMSFSPHDCWGLRRGRTHFVEQHQVGLRCRHIPTMANPTLTLCIPMIAQGETLGLFYLSAGAPEALPPAKQQLARTVSEQVALAIANLYLHETLQYQSIRDPLTGLFNRRYLEEFLEGEIERAQRHQNCVGLIMIDVDRFKQFNDTYGHDAGDRVLQAVGKLLRDNIRASDIACRYGGEEMLLVLPESSLEITTQRAEALRTKIASLHVTHNGQLLNTLTASFGVACFPQHGTTTSALLQAADTALYQSKTAGRDRVTLAR